ncbi:hypothetical protein GGI43DRAFT_282445 [Trichoderma evansii]
MGEEATETRETTHQAAKILEPNDNYLLPPPVPRRVQELRNPRSRSRKIFKARAKERFAKDHRRSPSPPRWRLEVVSTLENGHSFSARVKILQVLERIPELKDHVPQIISINPKLRSYTIRYTRCELVSFECEARLSQLSYDKILEFKHQLYGFVKLMYQNGVKYNLYPGNIFLYTPFQKESTRQLFLGAVEDSDLVDATELDWSEYRKHIWDHINRVFALLEICAYHDEASDLIAAVDKEKDLVESLIENNNAIIDAARVDVNEARTIMAETVKVFNKALINIKQLEALSDGFVSSIRDPFFVWDGAQSRKEVVERNLKKIEVLNYRTNALIQKYRGPRPRDGASLGDHAPQFSGELENASNMETVNSTAKVEDDTAKQDGELAIEDEEVIAQGEEIIIYDEEMARKGGTVAINIGFREETSKG